MSKSPKFNDLAKMTDRDIQVLLRHIDQKDLVVSLKETTKAVRDKVLGNMSQRVRGFISEEIEFLGPMPSAEWEPIVQLALTGRLDTATMLTSVEGRTPADVMCSRASSRALPVSLARLVPGSRPAAGAANGRSRRPGWCRGRG